MIRIAFILFIPLLLLSSCNKDKDLPEDGVVYTQEMRDFVIGISEYAKAINPNFYIIPQNGIELVSTNGEEDGTPNSIYLNAIDGNGQEDLFYGYDQDDHSTPNNENNYLRSFLNISKNAGNKILVTDYCSTHSNMSDSYTQNSTNGYTSFSANHRELDNIPIYPNQIFSENNNQIALLSEIQNFLYLINPSNFSSKTDFINAVTSSNYDLLIMDLFFHDGIEFTSDEIDQLKNKANGGSRLVISYMSIGEAEDYRYYWNSSWENDKPAWLDSENPDWEGNFKVKYWYQDWQNIMYGNENSYLKKVLEANFDGVYLDIIDAYEYYESL